MRTVAFAAIAVLTLALAAPGALAETLFQRQGHPGAANCTTRWYTQYVDHFTFGSHPGWPETYQQRVLTYDKYYRPGGPIFFYVGNEAPITAFADIAGLMWQNAAEFGAALVFAEHRFFGESFPSCRSECMGSLSTMQAMADYALLMTNLTSPTGLYPDSKGIITFGGSYGGMLSAWMRMKYPNLVTGAMACSAPIGMVSPDYDTSSYWAVVTRDATAAGGAAPNCSANVHQALEDIFTMVKQPGGGEKLRELLHLCVTPTAADANQLGYFVQASFDSMAMGNYPFPTYYISGEPGHPAPAWPMRVACSNIATAAPTAEERITNLYNAISVMINITGTKQCYDTSGNNPSVFSAIWDFMVCTAGLINEQPYFPATGPPHDMFWEQPLWPKSKMEAYCERTYGKKPRWGELWMGLGLDAIPASSNIIFANGLLDPWHSGGILQNVSSSILALIIPEGAHHLDLFFATPEDPPGVAEVRRTQLANIRQWMDEAKLRGVGVHHRETAASSHERATFRKPTSEHLLGSRP
uniref:Uncharacterized protein n=1 Tax=Neobodo designis TaxID=312471 RepID=A0A7S1Q9V3_NEODS|mmetsp:Transcript_38511/g.119029  ORF Transcript_38511/g.119029 Transcript_38511/m.119029 type:complete len:526 (+) Transcript_38511:34-1611(+)